MVVVVRSGEGFEDAVKGALGEGDGELRVGAKEAGWDEGEEVIDEVKGEGKEFGGVPDDVLEWDDEQFEGAWGLARPEDACGVHPELYAVLGDSARDVEGEGGGRVPVELVGTGEVCLDDAGAWAEPVE